MPGVLETRRRETADRLEQLAREVSRAAEIAADKACVYLIGSFAREEATSHSDLDLFILGRFTDRPLLSNLDEIRIKAHLIDATKQLGIPEFSGDGVYLVHYTVKQLIESIGTNKDDATNALTARLLLLLESKPLFGEQVYQNAIGDVITKYWRDFPKHTRDFMPAFLVNDILRLWRTFCVNYEARTKREPDELKAKGKLKNFKLKHSRLLTCYSALAYLLAVYNRNGTVTIEDAQSMVSLTPTKRLEWLQNEGHGESKQIVSDILGHYERFLNETDAPEEEMVRRIMANEKFHSLTDELGNGMLKLLQSVGGNSRLYRLLVV